LHHQTVQRCVVRAMAYGALAALLTDRDEAKKPTITPDERQAWWLFASTRPRSTAIR